MSCALAEAHVNDLVNISFLFDHLDVGYIVIKAHFGPRKIPVELFFRVRVGGKRLVALRPLSSAIVADPHIVAFIDKLKKERFLTVKKVGTIHS